MNETRALMLTVSGFLRGMAVSGQISNKQGELCKELAEQLYVAAAEPKPLIFIESPVSEPA